MKSVRRVYKYLIASILGVLGFSSCECSKMYGPPVEYGVPHATYNLKFQLTDEDNKPLEGTQLRVNKFGRSILMYTPTENLKTDSKGKIDCSVEDFGTIPDNTFLVYYEDDNEQHAGAFKDDSVKVQGTQIEEGKGWNRGTYELKATLKLKKKD